MALITLTQTAEKLGVSRSTVERMLARGEIAAHRLPTGAIRFDPEHLDNWLRDNRTDNQTSQGKPMTKVELITEQKRILLGEQQKELAVHAQHSLTLIENPGHPDSLEAVAASGAKLKEIANKLEIFESALSGAKVRDELEAEAVRLAKAADARNEASNLEAELQKDGREVDKTLITLARQLRGLVQTKEKLREAAFTVGQCTLDKNSPRYSDEMNMLSQMANLNISSPLAKGLIDAGAEVLAGLGELHCYVDRMNPQGSVEELARHTGNRLLNRLDEHLRRGA